MNWREIALHGAVNIARVVNIYEVQDLRVPGGKYRVKVLERGQGSFFAIPNVCVKTSAGTPDWTGGYGSTDVEARQDAVVQVGAMLGSGERFKPDDFEWSDPHDF
ncbi:hypothetical protein [Cystobacter fuscus]|uniref:hypothetical protein n=1 Tax=Cystobacter fuscus TaxID=43 RepID=UPI0012FE4EB8|nr:hypothetical protein [Cystobacter fuscus]